MSYKPHAHASTHTPRVRSASSWTWQGAPKIRATSRYESPEHRIRWKNTHAGVCAQSIVLHNLTLSAQKSTFPTALGLRVTGVDDSTFSLTGDAYSAIAMPSADTHTSRILQEDDTSLAYECMSPSPAPTSVLACPLFDFSWTVARKFPGYTADNLGGALSLLDRTPDLTQCE